MKRGPLLTLLAIVVLAGGLMVLNLTRTGGSAKQAAPAASSAPAASPSPPSVAPAAAPFPPEAKYTGHTDGAHASIAVSVRGGQVSAYLCDGKSVEAWYQGNVTDDAIKATGRGANTLTGSLDGSTLSGTVTALGKSWSYSASPVTAPAGLYRAKQGSRTVGWIKQSDGSVTGLANNGGMEEPAPPLDPATAQWIGGGDTVINR